MDPTKQPGIIFEGVYLLELYFELSSEPPEKLVAETKFKYKKKISEDGQGLDAFLSVDVASNKDNKPFNFTFTLVGKFKTSGEPNISLDDFSAHDAPALMMPYARELISNITNRSLPPTLNIPPMNISAILDSKKPT